MVEKETKSVDQAGKEILTVLTVCPYLDTSSLPDCNLSETFL